MNRRNILVGTIAAVLQLVLLVGCVGEQNSQPPEIVSPSPSSSIPNSQTSSSEIPPRTPNVSVPPESGLIEVPPEPEPIYHFIDYLENNISPSQWGGCDAEWSDEDQDYVVHLYITDENAVDTVTNAYKGERCIIYKHYTDFTVEQQQALMTKIEDHIALQAGDLLSTQVRYSIPGAISERLEDPYIFLHMMNCQVKCATSCKNT